jgi:hypothetical protein
MASITAIKNGPQKSLVVTIPQKDGLAILFFNAGEQWQPVGDATDSMFDRERSEYKIHKDLRKEATQKDGFIVVEEQSTPLSKLKNTRK